MEFKRKNYNGVRGSKSVKEFKVKRQIRTAGTSYVIALPRVIVDELGLLKNGVILSRKGNKLIIEAVKGDE